MPSALTAPLPAFSLLLALGVLVFSACGPESTTLEATGPFARRHPVAVEVHPTSDGSRLQLTLADADDAELTLDLVPLSGGAATTCWRSQDNEHACTLSDKAGVLKRGTLTVRGVVCEVDGWVEHIGSAWQLDLELTSQSLCPEGRYTATIEP